MALFGGKPSPGESGMYTMANNHRLLFLLKYLQDHSDENRPLTGVQIRKAMKENGFPVSIPTFSSDIRSLIEAGIEISMEERNGVSTAYSYIDREWSAPELQILIDAVSSSQFLTKERSAELIAKLSKMAGPSFQEELQPGILVSEHIKAPNKKILLNVQAIRRAIRGDHKVTFRYLQYSASEKKQIPKHTGSAEEIYVISPYATIYNNDRYYMVGYSDRRKSVVTFRIDRMDQVKGTRQCRVAPPEDFNVQDYTDKVFWMYNGREVPVTLRCRNGILDQVIDRFGEGIELENVTCQTFDVTVPVCVSGTFYAWVVQFIGEMVITGPGYVKDAYAEYLQQGIDEVLGEKNDYC